ncbi:uncharacterized protein [Pagrus major]|uniref:uncharacterized protein isoform X2 n=1 Tax=Pagrus major TaxID=143350 RepID=UPI003CC86962
MGNMQCPAEDAALLASVARDICPFPNYNPSPHFINMLSINSSLHLKNHYTAVQSSLTPKQLEDFTQGLRTTFGREGRVTLGGVGVVALSLAVLFDTLARQVRGECVSESEPIPGLFVKNLRGYYPPHVYTVSKYLRLVPHIANNPTRMKEETERYHKQFIIDEQSLDKMEENITLLINEDTTAVNEMLGEFIAVILRLHLLRITNCTADELVPVKGRPYGDMILNLNCDPQIADKDFLAKVQKSDNRTQEAFENCKPRSDNLGKTLLHHIAKLELTDVLTLPLVVAGVVSVDSMIAQREDFDLKASALGKWAE